LNVSEIARNLPRGERPRAESPREMLKTAEPPISEASFS
jgi:hypothetical protein